MTLFVGLEKITDAPVRPTDRGRDGAQARTMTRSLFDIPCEPAQGGIPLLARCAFHAGCFFERFSISGGDVLIFHDAFRCNLIRGLSCFWRFSTACREIPQCEARALTSPLKVALSRAHCWRLLGGRPTFRTFASRSRRRSTTYRSAASSVNRSTSVSTTRSSSTRRSLSCRCRCCRACFSSVTPCLTNARARGGAADRTPVGDVQPKRVARCSRVSGVGECQAADACSSERRFFGSSLIVAAAKARPRSFQVKTADASR